MSEYEAKPMQPWTRQSGEYRGIVGRENRRKNPKLDAMEALDDALHMPAEWELQLWGARAPQPLKGSLSRERLQIRVVHMDTGQTLYPFPVEISHKRMLAQVNALAAAAEAFGLTWENLLLSAQNNGGSFYDHFTGGRKPSVSTSPPIDLRS